MDETKGNLTLPTELHSAVTSIIMPDSEKAVVWRSW